jgi:DNA (cytosine-5)-methyltransferase 1
VQAGYGERDGQAARVPGLDKPLGTVVAGGRKHALVAAFLAKHYGDRGQRPGSAMREPVSTITASDHHALAAATLVKLRGENHGADLRAPLPTVTAGGFHIGEVRDSLTAYYGTDLAPGQGQDLREPTRTLTTKARLGLVTVEGVDYQIVDIGMRMLEPHELLSAQFGRFAPLYDLSAARTKSGKVRLIGNSVCPEVAEALVRANVRDGVAVDGYAAA